MVIYIERLSGVVSKAAEYECIATNPLVGLKKLKVAEANRVRFLSEKEYVALIKALEDREEVLRAAKDKANKWRAERHYPLYSDLRKQSFTDHLKPMVLLALSSGVRFGSLSRLQSGKHVDMSNKEHVSLILTPDIVKTERGYQVPFCVMIGIETGTELKRMTI